MRVAGCRLCWRFERRILTLPMSARRHLKNGHNNLRDIVRSVIRRVNHSAFPFWLVEAGHAYGSDRLRNLIYTTPAKRARLDLATL
jgi:hypothetical protein